MRMAGFTLIEAAITLVIVAFLLGGILRAQEVVNGAKVKKLAYEFEAVPACIHAYQDRYRALPGDDPAAASHLAGANAAPLASRGNGVIDSAWNSTVAADESRLFWQHVRLAGLAPGPVDVADPLYTPRNAAGGVLGVSSGTGPQLQVAGMTGEYQVCSSGIPGRLVKQLDVLIDDAETAAGHMRAVEDGAPLHTAAIATNAIDDSRSYTVCMTF